MKGLDVRSKIKSATIAGLLALFASGAAYATPADGARCALPRPAADAQIMLVGTYEGQAVSSVAVSGPDAETTLAYVDIAAGERPLYVVLVSYDAMIWVFRGETSRIAQAVLISAGGETQSPSAGAVGLPGARVSTAHRCMTYFTRVGPGERPSPYEPGRSVREAEPDESARANETLRSLLGRGADVTTAYSGIMSVALPSGRISEGDGSSPAPRGYHRRTWAEAMRFHPGGLVRINPADVVGAPTELYDVYPGLIGLAQLAGSGELEYIGGFDQRSIGDYRIVAPIPRWPAELRGAGAARFLIETGVPIPAGDPGHACVILRDGPRIVGESLLCDIAG